MYFQITKSFISGFNIKHIKDEKEKNKVMWYLCIPYIYNKYMTRYPLSFTQI